MPFHKLTGWTTYSLIEPIEKILGWKFDGLEDMTGLPEYRNGACMWSRAAACPARRQFVEPCSLARSCFSSFPLSFLAAGWCACCVRG